MAYGTEYGRVIPTITAAAEAQSFVDARITEGSDYIKIVYGESTVFPTIDRDVLEAVIAAAKKRNKLAVVHIGSLRTADEAITAGASGLVHIFADAPGDAAFARRAAESRAFVTPTLTVTESATGVAGGASLVKDARLSPFLSVTERASLSGSFPQRPNSKRDFANALAATKLLFDAGVPILAGTDAPNPGTAHGASLHRKLELLVRAGLSPEAALVAATSRPALAYSLNDRGRHARRPGARCREPDREHHRHSRHHRRLEARRSARAAQGGGRRPRRGGNDDRTGQQLRVRGGARRLRPWMGHLDRRRIGGTSSATMTIIKGGANGTGSALELAGTIGTGAPTLWAGALFFPGTTPMGPVNLSNFTELVFWARGDDRAEHQVLVFAARLGLMPATRPFAVGPEWKEYVMPLSSFSGIDGSDLRGVLFPAGPKPGAFRFTIDEVRFR